MATVKKRSSFFDSEEGLEIKRVLTVMTKDNAYITASCYSALQPDNTISFTDKHMHYLNTHPKIDPLQYIANLRLMTKVR